MGVPKSQVDPDLKLPVRTGCCRRGRRRVRLRYREENVMVDCRVRRTTGSRDDAVQGRVGGYRDTRGVVGGLDGKGDRYTEVS